MAITFDAVSNSDGVTPVSGVITFSHTVGSGSNRILCVAAFARDDSVVSVNSDLDGALTVQAQRTSADGIHASIWVKVGAAVGTHTITVTANTTGPTYLAGGGTSLFGIAQSSFVEDTDSVETTGANPTLTGLTTATDGCAMVDAIASNNTVVPVMNAELNRVQRASWLADSQERGVAISTLITKSPVGSITGGWDIGGNNCAYVAIALRPASGGGSTPVDVTRYPTTDTAVSGGWTTPSNVQADDDAVASINISQKNRTNDRQQGGYDFGSVIPDGSVINSVTIEVEHRVSTTSNIAFLENLAIVNGVTGAVNSDATEPTTLTARSYPYSRPGGGSWIRDDLLDANFVTRIRQRNGNSNVSYTSAWDYIRVTVNYTPPGGEGPLDPGDIWIECPIHYHGSFND